MGACLFNINRTKSRNNNSVALRTLMNVNPFSVFNVNNTVVKIKTGDAGNSRFPCVSFLYIKPWIFFMPPSHEKTHKYRHTKSL